MEVLWKRGLATVREISEALYPNGNTSHHATVQKLLDRLKGKQFVIRDDSVWPHQFRADVARDELIRRRLQTTADKLCGGSLQPLLTHLVRSSQLNSQDVMSLRRLLDDLDSSSHR
jgi:predicted transcriptional regulator